MPGTIRIARYLTLAEEVSEDHPAVVAAREGHPVDPSMLPVTLLGRDPSAITGSLWFVEAGGESARIFLREG